MTIYYVRIVIKEAADLSLMTKLKLLLKIRMGLKRLADKARAHPEVALRATEKAFLEIERLVDSGLMKDGYKLFEGDFVFISGDVTEEQLNEGINQIRKRVGEALSDLFGGIGLPTDTVEYFLDKFVQFEIHRALPVRRAVAAGLAAAKRDFAKGA